MQDQVRALGLTGDLTTAAHVLGIGRTLAFELVRTAAGRPRRAPRARGPLQGQGRHRRVDAPHDA